MGNTNNKLDMQKSYKTLTAFLNGSASLDKMWKYFDKDGNGTIDETELKDLIYCSLCFFCLKRDPNMPQPSREKCEPFVKKIVEDLKHDLDKNNDGLISRKEFEGFGKYLRDEYAKLEMEIQKS